jgi:urea transport system substrate-binding protein
MKAVMSKYVLFVFFSLSLIIAGLTIYDQFWTVRTIKIGVMTSLTGSMASRERVLVNAVELAVDEINMSGGLLGQEIELVVRDGASNPKIFAKVAEELISKDKVDAVFGCWTSSCRKSVLPVFEKHKHLLYYPAQYEGLENSKNIIYLGSVPNQQMIPALEWSFSKLGKKVYLLGSDYVYPRAANQIIKDQVAQLRGEIVGESYVSLGGEEFLSIVAEIKRLKPDVIFNTINGISNVHFFRELRSAGITSKDIPVFSFSISENEIGDFSDTNMTGDFFVLSYLQGLKNSKNKNFIQRYQQKYGKNSYLSETSESIYVGVHLWARAVLDAGSNQVVQVQRYASGRSIQGPGGMTYIDEQSRHSWKYMHIAQVKEERLESVWHSKVPVAPMPYPASRTRKQWQQYLKELQNSWGGHWQAKVSEEL